MRLRLLPIALVVLVLASLAAVPSEARHRDRRFNDRRTRVIVVDRSPRVLVRDRGFSHRPHGWNQGRKVGWRGCDLPPGLAKKYGCRSNFRNDHRRVQRRPVIILPFSFR